MAGYLRNPQSAPLDDINVIAEALNKVQRMTSLQIGLAQEQLRNPALSPAERNLLQDEIATNMDLRDQAITAVKTIRDRFIQRELERSGLRDLKIDPAEEDALDATGAFKVDAAIHMFVRQADPNSSSSLAAFERATDINAFSRGEDINAFSLSGALTAANKEVKALTDVYHLILKIIATAGPLVGIRPKASVNTSAYQSNSRNTERAGTGPIPFYEPLFTDEALAYVMMQGEAPEKDDIKALRDISLIHFFEKKERSQSLEYSSKKAGHVNCTSQRQEGIASLVVGGAEEPSEISLWKNDSKLLWYMIDETFQTQEQFTAVETALFACAAAWNKIKPGGVHFERAEKKEDAVFLIVFQRGGGNKEAVAFFPTEHVPGVSSVRIYENAIKAKNLSHLSNVLCHEFGHILGFRHEFALEKERSHQAGESDGIPDPNSVMSYNYPPQLTISDVKASRDVYKRFVEGSSLDLPDGRGSKTNFIVMRVDPSVGAL